MLNRVDVAPGVCALCGRGAHEVTMWNGWSHDHRTTMDWCEECEHTIEALRAFGYGQRKDSSREDVTALLKRYLWLMLPERRHGCTPTGIAAAIDVLETAHTIRNEIGELR